MKKSAFKSFIKEEIKRKLSEDRPIFPKGGSINGPHKQPIKDKNFTGKGTLDKGTTNNQYNVDREWNAKQIERLFALNHSNYDKTSWQLRKDLDDFERFINNWKNQRSSSAPNNITHLLKDFPYYVKDLGVDFMTHFGINPESEKSIISFLDNGTDSFLGNHTEYKKLDRNNNLDEIKSINQSQISPELISQMKDWVKDCQWGDLESEDIDEMSDQEIINGVKKHYEGGLNQFIKDANLDETTIVDKNTDSSQASTIASDEGTDEDTVQKAISTAKTSGQPVTIA